MLNEDFKYDRRRFMGTAAMTIAAAQLGMFASAAESKEESPTCRKKHRRHSPKRFLTRMHFDLH